MKTKATLGEIACLVAAIVFMFACVALNCWYEFKFKPQRYAEEVIKAQQRASEKSNEVSR
jgi:hypothetical protein